MNSCVSSQDFFLWNGTTVTLTKDFLRQKILVLRRADESHEEVGPGELQT